MALRQCENPIVELRKSTCTNLFGGGIEIEIQAVFHKPGTKKEEFGCHTMVAYRREESFLFRDLIKGCWVLNSTAREFRMNAVDNSYVFTFLASEKYSELEVFFKEKGYNVIKTTSK